MPESYRAINLVTAVELHDIVGGYLCPGLVSPSPRHGLVV